MIEVQQLHHSILDIPTLKIGRGRTAIIGPNGSGKTTFLAICAGIVVPQAGSIHVEGRSPRDTDVGWVAEFPDRNMLFDRVLDEIASPLRFTFQPRSKIREEVDRIAQEMGIKELLVRNPRHLSGGEKVLVALATALVSRPTMLVLDEFDSHLDRETWSHADRVIQKAGIPYVLLCTQRRDVALSADQVLCMDAGRVRDHGKAEQIIHALADGDSDRAAWGGLPA